jgi:hypothetical protein
VAVRYLVSPFAKLHRTLIFDLETNGNNGMQTVVIQCAAHLAPTFGLNY